tara:strand:+ start:124 stop:309 length:186 start_codon:yes stop_codon:yes gene_type:complete
MVVKYFNALYRRDKQAKRQEQKMNDYRLADLFPNHFLIPLAGWKITGMVKRFQKMSSRGNL